MRLPNKFRLAKSPERSAEQQKVHSDITPKASYREEWNLCGMGSVQGVCSCTAAQIRSSWENSSLVQRKLSLNGDNDNKMSTHIYTRPCALGLCLHWESN